MPKKTLQQIVPHPTRIRKIRSLRILGEWIYATNLWHINRYSASMAFFVGLFVAFMPVPGQMLIAAVLAVLLSCNLPLSVGLVWITNPLTMPAIFYVAYKIGAILLNTPLQPLDFELSYHWLSHSLQQIWQPFLLGCLLCGTFCGSVGYFSISMIWRWRVVHRWHMRKKLREQRLNSGPG